MCQWVKKNIESILNMIHDVNKREIVELIFGLNDKEYHTEEDVSKLKGITKQRVSQIKLECLEMIRSKFRLQDRLKGLNKPN